MTNDPLMVAVANLIKVKGRHHTEQAYRQLIEAYDAAHQELPKGESDADKVDTRAMRDAIEAAWYAEGLDIRGASISNFLYAVNQAIASATKENKND